MAHDPDNSNDLYDLAPIKAPRLTGGALRAVAFLAEWGTTSGVLTGKLLKDAGIVGLRAVPADDAVATVHPLLAEAPPADPSAPARLELAAAAARLGSGAGPGFAFESASAFTAAYRQGATTPVAVAERVLAATKATEEHAPALRIFIAQAADDVMAQARASAERWQRGEPLGPLDGVPIAVKDELDQAGYPTTVGTAFLGGAPAREDATVVARLRAAGAILIGKTNMHEIGLGVTGVNPHHGACRNPYDPTRATGGSSSGPAAAVAAGLAPFAVGADGGGSIRIPAALCGLVGLKATYGRISEHGAAPLCWSVAHVGPIAATARDCALGYAAMAGADPADPNSLRQPAPTLDGVADGDLAGVKLGVFEPWFQDAEPDVVARCQALVDAFVARGAEIVAVAIPELGVLRPVHLVTIVGEMAGAHVAHYAKHRREYGADTRLNLALARALKGYDYVHAQRLRARIWRHFEAALSRCDALITPATARTAPTIDAAALASGESNLIVTDQIMRFAPAANLTGLPAIAFPAGYDGAGLPVGLQAMGRPWSEALLLRLALVAEGVVERRAPKVHHRLLG